jgi:hypothetical protein
MIVLKDFQVYADTYFDSLTRKHTCFFPLMSKHPPLWGNNHIGQHISMPTFSILDCENMRPTLPIKQLITHKETIDHLPTPPYTAYQVSSQSYSLHTQQAEISTNLRVTFSTL